VSAKTPSPSPSRSKTRRKRPILDRLSAGTLAEMVCYPVSKAVNNARNNQPDGEILQLAGLVAAQRQSGLVVTLDENAWPSEIRGEPRQRFQRRGQACQGDARKRIEFRGHLFHPSSTRRAMETIDSSPTGDSPYRFT
jgi:hypothetical protein